MRQTETGNEDTYRNGNPVKATLSKIRCKVLRRLGFLKGDWDHALSDEYQFWEKALADGGKNWLQWEFKQRTDHDLELQDFLKELIPASPLSGVRILDVGAGPLTRVGRIWDGRKVEIVATDPLAEQYKQLLAKLKIRPPITTTFAHGEKLLEHFQPNFFDLAYASNSLDHSYDPLLAISQMLAVVKPLHYVYLWHFANVGVIEEYAGLHQWNFDSIKGDLVVSDGLQTHSVAARFKDEAEVTCESTTDYEQKVIIAKLKKLKCS